MRVAQDVAEATVALSAGDSDDTLLPNYAYNYDDVVELHTPRHRQYIRMWWTPESDLELEMRYLKKVRPMVSDSDYPEWPDAYHHLLVYKTLEDACLEFGMNAQAGIYNRRSKELLDRMQGKYLRREDRQYVRRGFDNKLIQAERWGIPTKL